MRIPRRILIVGKSPGLPASTTRGLEPEGFECLKVEELREAIEALRDSRFDVVLLDTDLRRIAGPHPVRELLAVQPGLTIIATASPRYIRTAIAAMQEGANDFVTKPVIREELLFKLDRVARAGSAPSDSVGTAPELPEEMNDGLSVTRDGTVVPANSLAAQMRGRTPDEAMGRATDRKLIEKALPESEEFSSNLLIHSPNPTIVINSDLSVEYVNPATETLTGFAMAELVGAMPPYPWWSDEEVRALDEHPSVDTGTNTLRSERLFRRKSGEEFWVDVTSTAVARDGETKYIIESWVDITRSKLALDALRESEAKYAAVVEQARDGVAIVQGSSLVFVNEATAGILGCRSEELWGRDLLDFVAPDNRAMVAECFRKHLDGEAVPHTQLFSIVRPDGTELSIELSVAAIQYANRPAVLGMMRDVTERERMHGQVQLTGKLAAVGELAAGVAHELNNPLAAIQMYAELLAENQDIGQSARDDVDIILKEARRAIRISENLLSFSGRHNPEKTAVSLNDVVESSLQLHMYRMTVNNIQVVKELDAELPPALADYHQMQQVFVNIITNCEQAMTAAHCRGTLIVRSRLRGDMVCVEFKDNGPGIPEADLKRIFDPFFTTKEEGKGTGLGLSICFGIVNDHNGRIHARSSPGRGAMFLVEIPLAADAGVESVVEASPVEAKL